MKPGNLANDLNNKYNMNNTNKTIDKLMSFYKPKKSTNRTNLNPNYFNQNKNINGNNTNNHSYNVMKNLNSNRTKGFDLTKNINPTRMTFSNGYSNKAIKKNNVMKNLNKIKEVNTFIDLSNPSLKQKIFVDNQKINLNNNVNNKHENRSSTSASSVKSKYVNNYNSNNNCHQKQRMGISQMNFYSPNMMGYFPNINNNKNDFSQNKINKNYNYDEFNYIVVNSNYNSNNYYPNDGMDQFVHLLDFEYKKREEKLRKGQNQLILEKLQQKYSSQAKNKGQMMYNTGTGFYQRNTSKHKNRGNKRKISAQDYYNKQKDQINCENSNNQQKNSKKEINTKSNEFKLLNENIEGGSRKKEPYKTVRADFNSNEYVQRNLEKRYSSIENKTERQKRIKHFFKKLTKIFGRKLNYLWSDKTRFKSINNNFNFNKEKRDNSYDYELKLFLNNSYEKKKKKNQIKRNNSDNSLKGLLDKSKQCKIKYFIKKSDYANFIKTNKIFKNENNEYDDITNSKSKEPKFQKIFDDDTNNNEKKTTENDKTEFINKDKTKNYKTSCNFFRQKQNQQNINNNEESKGKSKDDTEKKQHKFNIENIINNVIENNKKAAAARSSTNFYNIGRQFMNNRMRGTNTKFYNAHGGGFTGNKDTNFTKEQAECGQQFTKLNSLKITLLNPINWRKHEEIWGNLSSLNLGLIELEKYLMPPNETDVLISSYLKMYPRVLNFCTLTKINSSNTKNENNFISFMIDDNIANPKQEMKKWKEAYKRVILRWHPDKLYATLEEMKLMNEQQKVELKKKSTLIINNMNSLFKKIMEILKKVLLSKNNKEE